MVNNGQNLVNVVKERPQSWNQLLFRRKKNAEQVTKNRQMTLVLLNRHGQFWEVHIKKSIIRQSYIPMYIPSTLNQRFLNRHRPYIVAYTIDCLCSKMLNHGWNHGTFLSLFKLIPCPIHWIVYVLVYLNSIFKF